jgi:hypothetical protein
MRIVTVKVMPDPPPGMLHLHYTTPRGGRSTVGHMVKDGDSLDFIASELARRIVNDRQWATGYFDAKSSGSQVMIICMPEVANVDIIGDPGSKALEIAEWGQ